MASNSNLTYRILTKNDESEVVRFVQDHFIPVEPALVAANVRAEEEHAFPSVIIKNSLWQGVSIGVFDDSNGDLCAIRINMLGKNLHCLPYEDNDSMYSEKLLVVHRMLDYVNEGLENSLCKKNYMQHVFVIVNQAYARRGIATELYKRSEELARENGCEMLKATCTNCYTRRSVEKAGYVKVKEVPYATYVDGITGRKPFVDIPPPHISVSVLIKTLHVS